MVDSQKQNERLVFKRMDIRRREFNRSFDEGLVFDSPRNSFHSSRSAGSKNRSSGIFAFFKWFKKEKSEDSDFDIHSEQTSPVLQRATSITGSVDTLFSTATVNSFAYVHPLQYRPFGQACPPEIRIAVGPETNTYRSRIKERERSRYLEKNISLREKYRLYASGTLPRSADHLHELTDERLFDLRESLNSPESKNFTLGRKKKRAPPPPSDGASGSVTDIPHGTNPTIEQKAGLKQHRRTLSEPYKYVKACHIKGKRKAPPPPGNSTDSDVISVSTTNTNSSKRSRKKRRAPSPPAKSSNTVQNTTIINIIQQETNGVLNDEFQTTKNEEVREETASNASTVDIGSADVVCTDTLKLERGILKPNMDKPFSEPKICPSPVSPRPWYKRTPSKEGGSIKNKDLKKERDRRKVEDWMLESGFPRRSLSSNDYRFNVFSKADKADDKRKSQISILTNISELDREAAEIIRRGKEREKTLIDSHNAMYYKNDIDKPVEEVNAATSANSRKTSAKELISLFNAITNVTKVTVNSSFFSKDVTNMFNADGRDKTSSTSQEKYTEREFDASGNNQAIKVESFDEVVHTKYTDKPELVIVEEKAEASSASSSKSSNGKITRVTIEELDEYDAERNSKSQVLYEANRQVRHLSPPIPTITEVSEGSAKSSPSSTIASNTSDLPRDLPSEVQVVQVKQMNVWICPRCTLENLRWRITCEACDMWRPNPFELREKTNKTANENKIEQNKEENEVPNLRKSSLYPNLSPLKNNAEKSSTLETLESTKNIQNKSNKEPEHIPRSDGLTNGILLDNTQNEKKLNTKCLQENESKEKTIIGTDMVKRNSNPIISKQNNASTSSDNVKHSHKYKPQKEEKSTASHEKIDILEEKHKLISDQESEGHSKNTVPAQCEKNNEEVRQARIAFFNKHQSINLDNEAASSATDKSKMSINDDISKQKVNNSMKVTSENNIEEKVQAQCDHVSNNSIILKDKVPYHSSNKVEVQASTSQKTPPKHLLDDDKHKLREILIEMKHSLPKRPKPVKKIEEQKHEKIIVKGEKNQDDMGNNSTASTSKSSISTCGFNSETSGVLPFSSANNKAEAYLIESETIIEEIKLKKESEKVSSSVQTSGLVTQISPKPKPSTSKEIVIPIKVEENVIKNGILYTSTSNEYRKIGSGTFELLRPRDFANIKEIKTESKAGGLPFYANTVVDDSNVSRNSEDSPVNSFEDIDKLSKQLVKPQGVANFRARLDITNDKNMNTIAVNRLLKRLEGAIANGNHETAAGLARELAQLKVNCSVIRQKSESPGNEILVELYVEDRASHQGPFHMKVKPSMKVQELKELTEREYEIPVRVQRWILGKQLAGDDSATLESLGINTDGCTIFLYLVAPEPTLVKTEDIDTEVKPSASNINNNEEKTQPIITESDEIVNKEEIPVAGPSGVTSNNVQLTFPEEMVNFDVKPTGTLALGWKCEACTLMNSPTRPGCAACSTGRPTNYQVPFEYELSEAEAERIKKETLTDQESAKAEEEEKVKNYQKLIDLEKDDLILNPEDFECPVCLVEYEPMEGVLLRECLHVFCRTCLANTIHFSDEAEVKCPFRDNNYTCNSILLEREIKALVTPEAYEEHLAKSIAQAENKIGNAFHCKTPDCKGWCIYEDNVNIFKCPVCTHTNCLTCQAIHEGLNCKQFQEQLNNNTDMNIESKRTKEMLQEMVDRGEAMNCPTCQVVLMKKWGCDWLRCSMCKTEICWITRGPRWGPNGKGDTSGGCQCGVNGIKCHPKCTYCH